MGDVGGVQAGGGHLVQQRLEGREVVAVDQRDLDGMAVEAPATARPPNPAPTIATCGRTPMGHLPVG